MTKLDFQDELVKLLKEFTRNGGYNDNPYFKLRSDDGFEYSIGAWKGKTGAQMMVEKAFGEKVKS